MRKVYLRKKNYRISIQFLRYEDKRSFYFRR